MVRTTFVAVGSRIQQSSLNLSPTVHFASNEGGVGRMTLGSAQPNHSRLTQAVFSLAARWPRAFSGHLLHRARAYAMAEGRSGRVTSQQLCADLHLMRLSALALKSPSFCSPSPPSSWQSCGPSGGQWFTMGMAVVSPVPSLAYKYTSVPVHWLPLHTCELAWSSQCLVSSNYPQNQSAAIGAPR